MEKIYEQSKDLHVVATYVYGDDGKAYKDADFTEQYTTSELKEVFVKGAIISVDGGLNKAIGFSVSENIGTINYIEANATTATSADIAGLASVADPVVEE